MKILYVAAAIILMAVGYSLGTSRDPVIVTVTDTVSAIVYEAEIARLRIDGDGLRATLEGISTLKPEVVHVVDTLVAPPDTILRFVSVDSRGSLSLGLLASQGSLYVPQLRQDYDVSACDDGFQIEQGEVLCNRARFGHLWVGAEVGTTPMMGLWWKPSWRSHWETYVGRSEYSWRFGLRWGF